MHNDSTYFSYTDKSSEEILEKHDYIVLSCFIVPVFSHRLVCTLVVFYP